jgi:hypothetical protein
MCSGGEADAAQARAPIGSKVRFEREPGKARELIVAVVVVNMVCVPLPAGRRDLERIHAHPWAIRSVSNVEMDQFRIGSVVEHAKLNLGRQRLGDAEIDHDPLEREILLKSYYKQRCGDLMKRQYSDLHRDHGG